jgi:hypothetical protein
MYYDTKARSCNHCCIGEAINVTYCECMCVDSVNQHVMRMRHIVICGLPRPAIFFYISHKRHDFRKKV